MRLESAYAPSELRRDSLRSSLRIGLPSGLAEPKLEERRLVGAAGFEPATPSSQTRCATGLRYAPKSPVNRTTALAGQCTNKARVYGPFSQSEGANLTTAPSNGGLV